eukprot:364899-Chlamydomonas_euryale.AAC.29
MPAPYSAPAAALRRGGEDQRLRGPSCAHLVQLAHLPRVAGCELDETKAGRRQGGTNLAGALPSCKRHEGQLRRRNRERPGSAPRHRSGWGCAVHARHQSRRAGRGRICQVSPCVVWACAGEQEVDAVKHIPACPHVHCCLHAGHVAN